MLRLALLAKGCSRFFDKKAAFDPVDEGLPLVTLVEGALFDRAGWQAEYDAGYEGLNFLSFGENAGRGMIEK
jgi:hypothetical protein